MRLPRITWLPWPFGLPLLLVAACANPSFIEVTLTARDGLTGLETLRVEVDNSGDRAAETFAISGESFPLTFTVSADNREGDITVIATALTGSDVIAAARSTVAITPSNRSSISLALEPADFRVNSLIDGGRQMAFRSGRGGRAVAATPEGFVVTFVTDCLGADCDVFARHFSAQGDALELGGSTTEIAVSSANEPRVSVPAIAVATGGEIGIVWETDDAIRVSRFSANGALATSDLKVTADTVENPADPAIVGLDNEFVLSWFQEADTPISAGVQQLTLTGSALGALSTTRAEGDAQGVALSRSGGQVATAWSEGEQLFASIAVPGASGAAVPIATFNGEFVGAPQVASMADDSGYVVAYGRQLGDQSTGLMLTRVSAAGAQIRDVIVVPFSDRPTDRPSVAVDAENRVAVAWPACAEAGEPDGSGCAVMMRLYDAELSPLTEAIVVNTTTDDDQFDPAIVATAVGFAVVWNDNGGSESGAIAVRARILFLDGLL